MRRRRLTQQELGAALGIAHTSVGRWLGGSIPHKRTVQQLADYFGLGVDDLLDDSRDLPSAEPATTKVEEVQMPYEFLAKPIKTAAALAQLEHGPDPAVSQATFERHLKNLRAMRELAERQHPRDPSAAMTQLESLLAAYISALDVNQSKPSDP